MSFDYSAAKAAIKEAGHTVSNGPHVLATDIKEIVKFGRRVFGLSDVAVRKGIANPGLLPDGFPGATAEEVAAPVAESAPVDAEPVQEPVVEEPATPVEPEAAPAPEAPAEEAPKGKKSKKAAEESAPADATATEAPAAEQAAQ
jgi:hypothetical protein